MSRTALAILVALGAAVVVGVALLAVGGGGSIRLNPGVTAAVSSIVGGAASWIALRAARAGSAAKRTPRKPPIAQAADRLGLSYLKQGEKTFIESFRGLPEIPKSAKARHIMQGEIDGRALVIFQSSYMVYTGQTMMQVSHTVYTAEAPNWPTTHITPRNVFSRLAMKLGRTSGLMLENPQFNLRFRIKTGDEDFAIALLAPEMQAFMLEKTTARWHIGPGRVCLVYSGALKTARIEASLDRMRRFWSLVPHELEAW